MRVNEGHRETEGTQPRTIDRRDKKHKKGMKGGRHGLDNYSNTTFTVLCLSSQTFIASLKRRPTIVILATYLLKKNFPGYKLENEGRYSWAILLKFSHQSGGWGRVQFRQSCVNSNFSETSYEGKRNLRPMTGNLSPQC